jgi:DNA-binding NarL/FixJ family response regulator
VTIRILLVDDQPLLRQGFRMVLSSQDDMEVVGEAGDGDEAVRLTAALRPDVVLMDVRMPHADGIDATRRIVKATPESRVIILTTFDIDEYAYSGLNAGASGFLLKDVLPKDLLSGIRVVASGDAVIAPSVTRRLLDTFAHRSRNASATCSSSWLPGARMPRSLPGSWSPRRPSSHMSAGSSTSSTCATGSRRSSWRMSVVSPGRSSEVARSSQRPGEVNAVGLHPSPGGFRPARRPTLRSFL